MRKTLLAFLLGVAAAHAQPYRNPVIPFEKTEVADPHVLKYNGEYYLYTSGDPITAYHSRDLVNWKPLGPVLRSTPGAWNETDVWAPEVVYRNGKFYMFYTGSRKSPDWRVGEMHRRLGVAVADKPEGPFVDSGQPLFNSWAIDGTVYLDPATGQEYLYYSLLQEPGHPGAGIAVDTLTFDGTTYKVGGQPRLATQGSLAWEDKDGDPNNGSLRYTNEGPTVIGRQGKVYLLYSGGSWDMPTYAVGYAVADTPLGPFRKVDPPIMRATPWVDGPGHNALTKAPNNLDDVHVYHARTQPYLDPWNRMPFVERLEWNNDRPWTGHPSVAFLSPPEQPRVRELFDGPDPQLWEGTLEVAGGVARGVGQLRLNHEIPDNALVEVNFRGAAGVQVGSASVPLTGLNPGVFHQLLLRRSGSQVSVAIDGVQRPGLEWKGDNFLTLRGLSGGAEFDGIAVSHAWEDFFTGGEGPLRGWEGEGGDWGVSGGRLWQNTAEIFTWRVKGEASKRYEFSASLQPQDTGAPLVERPGPTDQIWKAGIVAGRDAMGGTVTAEFDKAIWPLGRFWVIHRADGRQPTKKIEVAMPRGFRYDDFHTLRVKRFDDLFTFFLDGREVASARFPIGASKPGLITENIKTVFDSLSYRELAGEQNLLADGGFESEQASEKPWKLTGSARLNESMPHSGLKRLLLGNGEGTARQTVPPGSYAVRGFVTGSAGKTLTVQFGTVTKSVTLNGEWQAFELPGATGGELVLKSSGLGYAAVDDVFLSRR